jgi:molecular chaperone GrpE (heat shock protein)
MTEPVHSKLAKWPFLIGDLCLLAAAIFVVGGPGAKGGIGETTLMVVCVAIGAILGAIPFILEYRALISLTETTELAAVLDQASRIEAVAAEIRAATSLWQGVHGEAAKAGEAARTAAAQMGVETKAFAALMQRANDSERATLRLELDKLRRAEGENLQVIVRILDHVFALHQAGIRSGQPGLIEQLAHFQNACCDAGRWIGLSPFLPKPGEPFDRDRHQLPEGVPAPLPGAVVDHALAVGFSFQGRLLRPSLVKLQDTAAASSAPAEPPSELPPAPPVV